MRPSSKGLRNVDHGQRPSSDLPVVLLEILLLFPSNARALAKAPLKSPCLSTVTGSMIQVGLGYHSVTLKKCWFISRQFIKAPFYILKCYSHSFKR